MENSTRLNSIDEKIKKIQQQKQKQIKELKQQRAKEFKAEQEKMMESMLIKLLGVDWKEKYGEVMSLERVEIFSHGQPVSFKANGKSGNSETDQNTQ